MNKENTEHNAEWNLKMKCIECRKELTNGDCYGHDCEAVAIDEIRLRREIADLVLPYVREEMKNEKLSSDKTLALLDDILQRYFADEYFNFGILTDNDIGADKTKNGPICFKRVIR